MLFSLCVWSFGVEYGMIWSGTRSTKHYRCVPSSVSARRYLFPSPPISCQGGADVALI